MEQSQTPYKEALLRKRGHMALGLDEHAPVDELAQSRDQGPLPGRPARFLQLDPGVGCGSPDIGDQM